MRGRVTSGRGDLAQWMDRYSHAYERALGAPLEPGSLNVVLAEPWVMHEPQARLEASEVGVGVGFVPCRLNGEPAWVVRTDRNNAGTGHHPLTVVEVVSAAHLRTALGLQDGDDVDLLLGRWGPLAEGLS
jgi:CTP-dependent riboflavin kinase